MWAGRCAGATGRWGSSHLKGKAVDVDPAVGMNKLPAAAKGGPASCGDEKAAGCCTRRTCQLWG
eukprot:356014-Chlamydomonas_euryale.AAC.1